MGAVLATISSSRVTDKKAFCCMHSHSRLASLHLVFFSLWSNLHRAFTFCSANASPQQFSFSSTHSIHLLDSIPARLTYQRHQHAQPTFIHTHIYPLLQRIMLGPGTDRHTATPSGNTDTINTEDPGQSI